jgi:hypothetical protein
MTLFLTNRKGCFKVWIVSLCAISCFGSQQQTSDDDKSIMDPKIVRHLDAQMSYSYQPISTKPTTISYIPTFQPPSITLSPLSQSSLPTNQPITNTIQPNDLKNIPTRNPTLLSETPNALSIPSSTKPFASNTTLPPNPASPSKHPAQFPTIMISPKPTKFPTQISTKVPTQHTTKAPTGVPTQMQTQTKSPTNAQSKHPSALQKPVQKPIQAPANNPLISLVPKLSKLPTQKPTQVPTAKPIIVPSKVLPTMVMTPKPTMKPVQMPTKVTTKPVRKPTKVTTNPDRNPTIVTTNPVRKPTVVTTNPVRNPTTLTTNPIRKPTNVTTKPVRKPTKVTTKPVRKPTKVTTKPVRKPTKVTTKPVRMPTKIPLQNFSLLPIPIPTMPPTSKSPSNTPRHDSTISPSAHPTVFKSFEPSTTALITPTPSDIDDDDIYECSNDGNGIRRVRRTSDIDAIDSNTTQIQLQVAYAAEFSGKDAISFSALSQLEEALLHAAILAALACGNKTKTNGRRMLWRHPRSLSLPITDTLGKFEFQVS